MKRYIFRILLLLAVPTIASLMSCGNDEPVGPTGGNGNVTAEVLMESPSFFKATRMAVSENGQYVIATLDTQFDGSQRNPEYYFSSDGGESFTQDNNLKDYEAVSNDGKVLMKNSLVDLQTNASSSFSTNTNVEAILSPDGTVFFVDEDPDNSFALTLYKFKNNVKESTGIASPSLSGTLMYDQGAIGIFSYYGRNMSEYEIASNTLKERTRPAFDERAISGLYSIVNYNTPNYSQGYWSIASTEGAVVISPDDQLTYYFYEVDYKYADSPVRTLLHGNKLYLQLYNYNSFLQGEGRFDSFETSNGALISNDRDWPMIKAGDHLYYSGFIEDGNRGYDNLVKESATGKTYLNSPLTLADYNFSLRYVAKVGEKVYYLDKEYDTSSGKYSTSPFEKINYVYSEPGKTIAYATNGTFLSTDNGNSWRLESDTEPSMQFVIKSDAGGYYGMQYATFLYYFGGTGFSTPAFSLHTYSSTDGITWQSIASYPQITGGNPPGGISPVGEILYITNANPLGNPDYFTNLSNDAGFSFTTSSTNGQIVQNEPGLYQTYNVINGRHVAFTNNPIFKAFNCNDFVGGCTGYEVEGIAIDYLTGVPHYTPEGHAVVASTAVYEIKGL
ncbi:MAG: hypothetical protein RIC35_09500 [Marinoscillum sp.]